MACPYFQSGLQLAQSNLDIFNSIIIFEMIFVSLRSTCCIVTARFVKYLPHALKLTLLAFPTSKVSEEKIVMQWRYKSWPEGTKFN